MDFLDFSDMNANTFMGTAVDTTVEQYNENLEDE